MSSRALERGERVFLRHPLPGDEPAFLDAVRSSRELHLPWTHLPTTPQGFGALLERQLAPTEDVHLICRNEDGSLVGLANLSQIVLRDFRNAYLGYSAFVPHDGRGYMTEGLRLVLRRAFGPVGLHRVEANVQPDNDAIDRARGTAGVPARGVLAAVPEDRRALAGPRSVRDPGRRVHRVGDRTHRSFPSASGIAARTRPRRSDISRPPRSPRLRTPTGRTRPRTDRARDARALGPPRRS